MKEKKQRELRLERFLGKKRIIIMLLALQDFFFLLTLNYLLTVLSNLPAMTHDRMHPEKYIGIQNCWPDAERLHGYFTSYGWRLILVLLLFLANINVIQAYKMRRAFSDKGFNLQQKGSARWTTKKEIKP